MPYFSRLRAAVAVIGSGLMTASVLTAVMTPAASAQTAGRPPLLQTALSWATSARSLGEIVTTGTVDARVYLASAHPAALKAYATAVSTPGNPLYGHYLTAAQAQRRFGPGSKEATAVESWLTSAGMHVTRKTGEFGGFVSVTGSVLAAARTFAVTFGMFKGPDGKAYRANVQAASVPSSVARDVLTISGLSTFKGDIKPADKLPPPGPNNWIAPPVSSYWGQKVATNVPQAYGKSQPWTVGYTQAQIRDAYGVTKSGMTGKGQTVAIVDAYASPTMPGDANKFAKVSGDKPFRKGQFSVHKFLPFTGTAANECGAQSWYGEETLDIEAVHGQAPNANVRVVAAASCFPDDLANADAYIVNHHLATIVSGSWGGPADGWDLAGVMTTIFEAGATEGIGFFQSTGDQGYNAPAETDSSDRIQVSQPAGSPWVTAVGGTSLAIGKTGNYEFETSWGTMSDLQADGSSWSDTPPGTWPDDYNGSGGGGVSTTDSQPAYQRGVVPRTLAMHLPNGKKARKPMRVVPDVSALADPSTGMIVGQTTLQPDGKTYAFSLSEIGGTSVAAPVFAGIEADAQQAAGHRLGFANPMIYQRARHKAFHDVTDHPSGRGTLAEVTNFYTTEGKKGATALVLLTLAHNGQGTSALRAVKGYDDSTGVGSPKTYIQSFKN